MIRSIVFICLVTLLLISGIYVLGSDKLNSLDQRWLLVECISFCTVGIVLFWLGAKINSQDDPYIRTQSLYINTLLKFITAALVIGAYIIVNRPDYEKTTVYLMLGIYLVYHIITTSLLLSTRE